MFLNEGENENFLIAERVLESSKKRERERERERERAGERKREWNSLECFECPFVLAFRG